MRNILPLARATHEDKDGESFTRFRMYLLPDDVSDEDIQKFVDDYFPSTYCQHSYDCCANFYASTATWSRLNYGMLVVAQIHRMNI